MSRFFSSTFKSVGLHPPDSFVLLPTHSSSESHHSAEEQMDNNLFHTKAHLLATDTPILLARPLKCPLKRDLGWVARQRPRPTLRQGCTCWVPTGDHGTSNDNCHYPKRKFKALSAIGTLISSSTKRKVAQQKFSPNLGRPCIWADLHETGGLSATLAVNRLGCCRATRLC